MTRRIIQVLLFVLLVPVAAGADVAALSYQDPYGEAQTVAPSQQYINPVGGLDLYLTAGLDRKVGYVLKDGAGQTVAEGVSDLITAADNLTVLGSTYYGKVLAVPSALAEGSYTLTAQILTSGGSVVASQNYALVVDRTPPTAGELWWDAYAYTGTIMANELVGSYESRYIVVKDVDDASGIARVQFESFYPSTGEVYKSAAAWYDAPSKRAGIGNGVNYCIGTNYLPPLDGQLGVRFLVYDKAGNKTAAQATVRYDGQSDPAPELIAIYNPNVTTELIPGSGLVGYVPYTPGMTAYSNPLKLLYRVLRSNWSGDNPDYGLTPVNGTLVYTDAEYAYYRFDMTYSPNGPTLTDPDHRFKSARQVTTHFVQYNVVLDASAPPSPALTGWQLYRSDVGWEDLQSPTSYTRKLHDETAVTQVRVTAAPPAFQVSFQPLYSKPNKQEPLNVLVRPRFTGGHPGDRIMSLAYGTDAPGAAVLSSIGQVTGLPAGNHTITVTAATKFGQTVTGTLPVEVLTNQPPSCTITSRSDARYLYLAAACSDPDGNVAAYRWYRNGRVVSCSNRVTLSLTDAGGSLEFEALDNGGAQYQETVNPN